MTCPICKEEYPDEYKTLICPECELRMKKRILKNLERYGLKILQKDNILEDESNSKKEI